MSALSSPHTSMVKRPPARIAALVLAAGRSSRMGGDVNKLLLDLQGRALIDHVLSGVQDSLLCSALVVTGGETERLRGHAQRFGTAVVENRDYAEGIASSIRCGVAAVGEDIDGLLIMLADMPLVGSAIINALVAAYAPEQGRAIIAPCYRGRQANPVLWGRAFFSQLLGLQGDRGAKALLRENASQVYALSVDDPAVCVDIDTPAMLCAVREGRLDEAGL